MTYQMEEISPQLFKQLLCLRKESLKKNSGFSWIRTHDLCNTGAALYQLSYQANWAGHISNSLYTQEG